MCQATENTITKNICISLKKINNDLPMSGNKYLLKVDAEMLVHKIVLLENMGHIFIVILLSIIHVYIYTQTYIHVIIANQGK